MKRLQAWRDKEAGRGGLKTGIKRERLEGDDDQ